MKLQDLLERWQSATEVSAPAQPVHVRVPVGDLAKLEALAQMYPGVCREEILANLLSAALEELEAAMPYVQGEKVVAEDEYGDPIFEDVGPTPRFQALTLEHRQRLLGGEE
jgi:hypothetical protein